MPCSRDMAEAPAFFDYRLENSVMETLSGVVTRQFYVQSREFANL